MQHTNLFKASLAISALAILTWSCSGPKAPEETLIAAGSTGAYGKDTTIFTLCWLANINSGMVGSPAALQAHAISGVNAIITNDTVENLIGNWTVLWGPVTYTHDSTAGDNSISDNTMMLVQGKDPADPTKTLYVIAVAGTNSISLFDWEDEDFSVQKMVKWPAPPQAGQNNLSYFVSPPEEGNASITNSGNYISQGIALGLNNLFNNMQDGSKGTLIEYLKNQVGNNSAPVELAVTGHSLGGGLSPEVALALKDNQSYWNPSGSFTITSYPYAGQSPGNSNFASYFQSRIGAANFHGLYNVLDAVPHGFNSAMMEEIGGLYAQINQDLDHECFMTGVVNCIRKKVLPFNYTSLYGVTDTFTGNIPFSESIYQAGLQSWESLSKGKRDSFALAKNLHGCLNAKNKAELLYARTLCFAYMAYEHHISAYIDRFGIHPVYVIFQRQLVKSKTHSTKTLLDSPLIKACLT